MLTAQLGPFLPESINPSVDVSSSDQAPVGEVSLQFVDSSGTPVESLENQNEFTVNVFIRDTRDAGLIDDETGAGFFTAFIDLNFDPTQVLPVAGGIASTDYTSLELTEVDASAGVIRNLGGIDLTFRTREVNQLTLLTSVRFMAVGDGDVTFEPSAPSIDEAFLQYGTDHVIPDSQVSLLSSSLTVGVVSPDVQPPSDLAPDLDPSTPTPDPLDPPNLGTGELAGPVDPLGELTQDVGVDLPITDDPLISDGETDDGLSRGPDDALSNPLDTSDQSRGAIDDGIIELGIAEHGDPIFAFPGGLRSGSQATGPEQLRGRNASEPLDEDELEGIEADQIDTLESRANRETFEPQFARFRLQFQGLETDLESEDPESDKDDRRLLVDSVMVDIGELMFERQGQKLPQHLADARDRAIRMIPTKGHEAEANRASAQERLVRLQRARREEVTEEADSSAGKPAVTAGWHPTAESAVFFRLQLDAGIDDLSQNSIAPVRGEETDLPPERVETPAMPPLAKDKVPAPDSKTS
ncbi:MAG: hypothetical protein AAGA03_08795 [Planctomycetota bacterium]